LTAKPTESASTDEIAAVIRAKLPLRSRSKAALDHFEEIRIVLLRLPHWPKGLMGSSEQEACQFSAAKHGRRGRRGQVAVIAGFQIAAW
jgi:hypothetical protein